jgi:hypothetical protein
MESKLQFGVKKMFSLSALRAELDGAYTLMSLIPLYSAVMARPEGAL